MYHRGTQHKTKGKMKRMASWERKLYKNIGKNVVIEKKDKDGKIVKETVKLGFGPYNKIPFCGR